MNKWLKNEKGSSIVEYIILLSIVFSIIMFMFPSLRNGLFGSEQEYVAYDEYEYSENSNLPEGVQEVEFRKFNVNPIDQANKLGRYYKQDLETLNNKYSIDLKVIHYVEESFSENKQVYFELDGSAFLTTLEN